MKVPLIFFGVAIHSMGTTNIPALQDDDKPTSPPNRGLLQDGNPRV
jgi:hypothetical protein